MSTLKLPNYLRSRRKRLGFTQDELAFLLCLHDGSKVCRYERFAQQPGLKTVFAYEVVFRSTAQELFGGIYQAVQLNTLKRVNLLSQRLQRQKIDPLSKHKLEVLNALINS